MREKPRMWLLFRAAQSVLANNWKIWRPTNCHHWCGVPLAASLRVCVWCTICQLLWPYELSQTDSFRQIAGWGFHAVIPIQVKNHLLGHWKLNMALHHYKLNLQKWVLKLLYFVTSLNNFFWMLTFPRLKLLRTTQYFSWALFKGGNKIAFCKHRRYPFKNSQWKNYSTCQQLAQMPCN